MAKKNCKLWLACVVILLLIAQGYFVAKLLSSKVPNRESLTFVQKSDISKKDNVDVNHKATQRNDTKPRAVDRANMEKMVGGLPQKKAALQHHHLKRHHLNFLADYLDNKGPEPLVETDGTLTPRPLTANEQAGNNILFTLRTTRKFHEKRLPVLFDTWLTTVNTSNVFLVTDGGEDKKWKGRAGMDVLCCTYGYYNECHKQFIGPVVASGFKVLKYLLQMYYIYKGQ